MLALVIAPIVASLAEPFAWKKLERQWWRVERSFTIAPAGDRSVGETILVYAGEAAVDVKKSPNWLYAFVSFSPDGESFLTIGADRRFTRIETATGRRLADLGEPMPLLTRWDVAWSPNGRYVAIRMEGAEVK